MSIFKKLGAALLLAAISLPVWAASSVNTIGGDITVKTRTVEAKSIAVQLYNLDKENTLLQVKDQQGNVYFEKSIHNHNGFSMILDLESLPEGTYLLSVNREDGNKTQVVRVMDNRLLLSQIVDK
ncbi:MAG: hypothetical protein H6560_20080 [Lewinellaceae bacterium]|nr:hypothetical protein [Lewinellaceae bacterium]